MKKPEKIKVEPPVQRSPAALTGLVTASIMLLDYFDCDAKVYKKGWSDARIARETELSETAVAIVRERDFGPLVINTAEADLDAARAAFEADKAAFEADKAAFEVGKAAFEAGKAALAIAVDHTKKLTDDLVNLRHHLDNYLVGARDCQRKIAAVLPAAQADMAKP